MSGITKKKIKLVNDKCSYDILSTIVFCKKLDARQNSDHGETGGKGRKVNHVAPVEMGACLNSIMRFFLFFP
jgi:hypothetical protein